MFQEKIDSANTVMTNLKVPNHLRKRVIDFVIYTQSNLEIQGEVKQFKNMISPSLQEDTIKILFYNVVQS